MATGVPFEPALRAGFESRQLGQFTTTLPGADAGAPYDRHAAFYDRIIGNRLYNRLVWRTDPASYRAFAAEAVAAGRGPLLDAGCGTALFTAAAYHAASRPLVLLDRSSGMLEHAATRLHDTPASLVQGDLYALPFAPQQFETVCCHAMLHVLEDPAAALHQLATQVAPGGRVFASMLVGDRGGVSRRYQRMLHARGEFGVLWSTADFEGAAREAFGDGVRVARTGAMAWLRSSALGY